MQCTSSRIMHLFMILLLWLAGGCASDRPPTGGQVDTTPLQVIVSNPSPSSVNASTDSIHLTFSHYISGRQLLNSLVFSPSIGTYDLTVKGNEVEIKAHKPLEKGRTYIITLDKNLKDYRGRTFPGPYTLAFSTGPVIDTGRISGKVINENFSPASNALLFAYTDRNKSSETDNLLTREPDYLVQANSSGAFSFNHISPGSYKIFAVNDRNSNLHYNPATEEIGLSNASIIPAGSSNLIFRLDGVQNNTDGLLSCTPLEKQLLEIKFGRPINITSFNPAKLEIRHAVSHTLIPAVTWFSKNRSLYDQEFLIVTDRLQPNQPYLINYSTNESQGKPRTIPFYGSSRATGNRPVSVTITPENKIDPAYLDRAWPTLGKAVIINFFTPVSESALNQTITFSETGIGKQKPLHFSLIKIDPRTFALKPINGFVPGHSYIVNVNLGIAKPVVSQFRTADKKDTGSITGKGQASGKYVVIEAKVSGSTSTYSTTVLCNRNGTFRYAFPELPPGIYTVSAFIPSGIKQPAAYQQWNPGSIKPYTPAEPFWFYPNPVHVRTGWTTENIDIAITTSR
ncbi:MAG: Ig-like domain-containing protein [Chlorobiales bacterium]|nr:Ig-like domain-containing protein [Chlorobiales bacterium]